MLQCVMQSEKVAAAEKSVKGAKRHAELHELIAAETTECLSVLDEVIKRIIARLQVLTCLVFYKSYL